MPKQRGKTHNLTFTTEKIDKAVHGFNGGFFTPKEIHEITGINKHTVNVIFVEKVKKGLLQRIRRGCYKAIPGRSLAINRPSAFIATKVWELLFHADRPLTNREISEIIEENTKLNFYFQIGRLLFRWYRIKAIDKIGGKKPYEYQIRPGKDKDRPVAS